MPPPKIENVKNNRIRFKAVILGKCPLAHHIYIKDYLVSFMHRVRYIACQNATLFQRPTSL